MDVIVADWMGYALVHDSMLEAVVCARWPPGAAPRNPSRPPRRPRAPMLSAPGEGPHSVVADVKNSVNATMKAIRNRQSNTTPQSRQDKKSLVAIMK